MESESIIMKMLRSERGAASVLVIFMMIILVIFGALSLTAALANYRLGVKVHSWMEGFYELDSRAEILCAEMDKLLLEAEESALAAIAAEGNINIIMQDVSINSSSLFAEYYFGEADRKLRQWAASKPEIEIEVRGAFPDLEVSFTLIEEESASEISEIVSLSSGQSRAKHLTVVLKLNLPAFRLEQTPSGPLYYREDSFLKRYTIVQWQQWQEPPDFEDIEFWDGTIPE